MAQPTNPSPEPAGGVERHPVQHQGTVLMTDVPFAAAGSSGQPASSEAAASLTPAALAALSQRYDILAEAGHGSMGNVYKARDRETGEIVALKLLKPEIASDQSMMERFKNELLFARKITHKNVCRVHEFNRIGGIAYTSMEFVEGESLRSVMNRFGGLPPRKSIDLVGQICSGLKEAHAQGIVHRDLKPENVMIDSQGNVKIMDFGIARSMEAVTKLTGSMVGTPAYMAPEQVGGKSVDYRTDIYSLGLIMYEVFTGTQAFHADNAVAIALKQMQETPVPPHEVEPSVPVAIERAILKCLEKEPAKRFQSVSELEASLRVSGAPARVAANNLAPNFPSHAVFSPQLLQTHAAEAKRTSPVTWVFLGALLVIGAFAGWRSMQVMQSAERLPPPAALPVPAPPDFALDKNSAQPPDAQAANSTPAAPETGNASSETETSAEVKPEAPTPNKKAPTPPAVERETTAAKNPARAQIATPKAVQRRAEKAFGENENEPVVMPPVTDHLPSYVFVGRFEREDRAQLAAKKIRDLGLMAAVVPRHIGASDFFIVVTGPYGPERVESAMEWLKTQGFREARVIKSSPGNPRQIPN